MNQNQNQQSSSINAIRHITIDETYSGIVEKYANNWEEFFTSETYCQLGLSHKQMELDRKTWLELGFEFVGFYKINFECFGVITPTLVLTIDGTKYSFVIRNTKDGTAYVNGYFEQIKSACDLLHISGDETMATLFVISEKAVDENLKRIARSKNLILF